MLRLFFEVGTACLSLEYRLVVIITKWVPFVVFGIGSSMCMAINSSEPLVRKSFRCCVRLLFVLFWAHHQQSVKVVCISLGT